MPVTWGELVGLVSLCPAAPSLEVRPTLICQSRGEPLAPLASPSGCCSCCLYPPCCCLRSVQWVEQHREPVPTGGTLVWHHCLAPCQGEHLAQAQKVPWQDPGAASLLNIDGHCLHGGLGAPALQIIFPVAGPAQVPPCSQPSSWVG